MLPSSWAVLGLDLTNDTDWPGYATPIVGLIFYEWAARVGNTEPLHEYEITKQC